MNDIDKRSYYIALFDLYGPLFTKTQKVYFEEYYLYDISLQEIANNYEVSRSAVGDSMKKIIDQLVIYENKLCFHAKNLKKDELLEDIYNLVNDDIKEKINVLREI